MQSAFASANHWQGQLQTSQTATVRSSVSEDTPSDLVHKMFSITDEKRRMIWAGHIAVGKELSAYQVMVRNSGAKG